MTVTAASPPANARWQLHTPQPAQTVLTLEGNWIAQAETLPSFAAERLAGARGKIVVAGDGIGAWDSGLIEFLWDVKRAAATARLEIDVSALPQSAQKLLALLPSALDPTPAQPRSRFRPLYWVGGKVIGVLSETGALLLLSQGALRGCRLALRGRAKLRAADVAANIRDAGPSALAIVGIVNFLVGAILGFVGAAQLRKFAAEIYVANLVGLAVVREMAAVMTAIVMSGRTGGAYAARIATMQGNEEIDALQVFGISVSDYVVLPAIMALVVTLPVLYLYGCLLGMIGGLIVAMIMLGVTATAYLQQTFAAVSPGEFIFGFLKSIAFAGLIGVTSCRIGLRAGRSAADVGHAATKAVVMGIVGVIALDAVFAVIAESIGF
jgi:phospholipid/cholesterol/gamma-HCH transport system permease protein